MKLATSTKYHNRATVIDNIRFDSLREARRYGELRLLERAGKIVDLRVHVRYPLVVEGVHICVYEADFTYEERVTRGMLKTVIEDVKSPATRTRLYIAKRNLMLAIYGVRIRET